MSTREKRLVDLLQAKRREDPEGFRKYLPGVDALLPGPPPRRRMSRSPFGLTEQERAYHKAGLLAVLSKLDDGRITPAEAAKGLQHHAHIVRDDAFGFPAEGRYESVKALIKAAIGKSPGSYKAKATVPLDQVSGGPVAEQVSVLMGVHLDLDRNGDLVSISINPKEVRRRREVMAIIGMGRDPQSDVAARHDDYLAMQDPHGAP